MKKLKWKYRNHSENWHCECPKHKYVKGFYINDFGKQGYGLWAENVIVIENYDRLISFFKKLEDAKDVAQSIYNG